MFAKTFSARRACAFLAGASLLAAPLAAQTVRAISQSDKAEGAKAHPQLLAEFGGAETGPQATYVADVGKTIALQSGLGNARSDFTVTLLNSSVNNAFAIPGGYVYVTRELVALMNNEAELAGVLGHEVGHVAARHSAKRQSAATKNTILGVLGAVLGSVVGGGFGNLISQGAQYSSQLLTLKYSRSQETQADNLGIQYLRGAGYDPRAMSTVLASLANQTALDARLMGSSADRVPEWASTHPDPAGRVRAALVKAGANATGATNRDTFLTRIDGLTYGDDPKQGVIEGNVFTHPDFRLTFNAPNGYYLMNGTQAVSITGQSGKGQFTTAPYNGNLETYVQRVFAGLTQQGQAQIPIQNIQRTTVNGLEAAYGNARVNSGNGQVDVVVFAYEFSNNQAFHFVTVTQAGRASVFDPLYRSVRRISASEAAAVRPRKLDVVTVRSGDTVQSLASRMAYSSAQLERFLVLNGLSSNSSLAAGQKVKLIVY
ncbi:MAG TPA: M48 family metalloprotease [Novosphingobium sp.]|nr:M48 family metalloprotease [Novosphingobium sp.]